MRRINSKAWSAIGRKPLKSSCRWTSSEDDWVVLGHLDRPMKFDPTVTEGEDIVRAETEMYRLYRKIEDKEANWVQMVDLFTVCDQELVATAYMWAMYLKIVPTLFGVKREYGRMLHYHHEYDTRVLNVYIQKLLTHRSEYEAHRLWMTSLLHTNKTITIPNTESVNIMLEQCHGYSPEEDEWWLDRGVLFIAAERRRPNYIRRRVFDAVVPMTMTPTTSLDTISKIFELAFKRHKVTPDFTTLYLLARACPVELDMGRYFASAICMFMETIDDADVPLEARLLVSEFLHWKLENFQLDPSLSLMQGPALKASEKMLIFVDDCVRAATHTFRADNTQLMTGKRLGKNQIDIDLPR
eukprot:TRINITY_DN2517_c0_g1_i1.p1 TRINITY_DN2517_c0_g1~~TRINITY_DN2517_c0_g1_i1.p1  ORF type:complete len:355 (+),score=54.22 TRINITY_DN2517_c0_g1_i1:62-1126(+)